MLKKTIRHLSSQKGCEPQRTAVHGPASHALRDVIRAGYRGKAATRARLAHRHARKTEYDQENARFVFK